MIKPSGMCVTAIEFVASSEAVTELAAISEAPTAFAEIVVAVTAFPAGEVSCGLLPIYAIMFAPCMIQ